MRQQAWPKTEDLQTELDWYEDLNRKVIKLDREYKSLAIGYHSVEPDVRDEIATGGTNKHQDVYEYARGGEAPVPIKHIRILDNIVREARFMAARGRWWDYSTLKEGKEDATNRLEDLERCIWWVGEFYYKIQQYDSTGRHAVVVGQGTSRFDAMSSAQKSRFLLWVSQTREIQFAVRRRLIKSKRDIVELVMGEEERTILEWPEVVAPPRDPVTWQSPRADRRRRRRMNAEPERELRRSHGPGAAFAFR
jgi:hypothetical protein